MKLFLTRLWVWLVCWDALPIFFRHKRVRVVQDFGNVTKIRCDRCGKYFALNHQMEQVLPWDDDIEQLYAVVLGHGRTVK